MDILEILSIAGYLAGAGAFAYTQFKKNQITLLQQTIADQEKLLETKEKLVEGMAKEIANIKQQMASDKIIYNSRLNAINDELALLKHQNETLLTEIYANKESHRTYRDLLIEARDKCTDNHCDLCKRITKALERE